MVQVNLMETKNILEDSIQIQIFHDELASIVAEGYL